jgi:hypothetical protein
MPRKFRIDARPPCLSPPQADDGGHAPRALQHIIIRGIERKAIFKDVDDQLCGCRPSIEYLSGDGESSDQPRGRIIESIADTKRAFGLLKASDEKASVENGFKMAI